MLPKHKTQHSCTAFGVIWIALLLVQFRFSAEAAVLETNLALSASSNTSFYAYQPPAATDSRLQVLQLSGEDVGRDATSSVAMAENTRNLTAITWDHAVNSQQQLNEALESDIDMIEADIVLGKLHNAGADLPVMAHPPANTSDISLAQFLTQITEHNAAHAQTMKGVKLDFKSIEVFEGSLGILNEMMPNMSFPVWLNADIIRGPVNQTSTIPVDADRFFAGCANFEQAVLSIGWTTRWGANYTDDSGIYTPTQIDEMLQAIKRNNIAATQHSITFPVRAGIAANSHQQLHDLVRAVNESNEATLTIWSSENDFVNVEKLRQLIFSFGFERVYLDVPEQLASKLDLGCNTGNALGRMSLLNYGLISACLLLASYWLPRS